MSFKSLGRMFSGTKERPSPSDIVPRNNIVHSGDAGRIEVSLTGIAIPFSQPPKVWVPPVPDTNSMDPVLDAEHNNILIAGADEEDQRRLVDFLKVGDIAVYQVADVRAIHRIVKIETDSSGRRFTFKGDSNPRADPYLVRAESIQWLSIGTIC